MSRIKKTGNLSFELKLNSYYEVIHVINGVTYIVLVCEIKISTGYIYVGTHLLF